MVKKTATAFWPTFELHGNVRPHEQKSRTRREAVLQEVAGMWKDRTDLPDFDAIRGEWQRTAS